MSTASKNQPRAPSSRVASTNSRRSEHLQEVRAASEEMLRVTRAAARVRAQKAKLIATAAAREESAKAEVDRKNGEAAAAERRRAAEAAAALESERAELEEEEDVLQAEGDHARRILDAVAESVHEATADSWGNRNHSNIAESIAERTSAWAEINFPKPAAASPQDAAPPNGTTTDTALERATEENHGQSMRPENPTVIEKSAVQFVPVRVNASGDSHQGAAQQPAQALQPGAAATGSSSGGASDEQQLVNKVCQVFANVSSSSFYNSQLPVFAGDPIEFIAFKAIFEQSTSVGKLTDAQNLLRLQKSLRGKARESVAGLLLFPSQVNEIIKTLSALFGNSNTVINRTLTEVRKLGVLSENIDQEALIQFACKIKNLIATLRSLERNDHLFNPDLLSTIIAKLPKNLLTIWITDKARQTSTEPVIVYFAQWLEEVAVNSKDAGIYNSDYKKSQVPSRDRRGKDNASYKKEFAFNTGDKAGEPLKCPKCAGTHFLSKCDDFKALSVDERWAFAREERRCYKCLAKSHGKRACPAYKKNPKSKYHFLLTNASVEKKSNESDKKDRNTDNESQEQIVMNTVAKNNVLLKVLPVILTGPKGSKTVYGLADEGSTISLLDQGVANELGIDGPSKPLQIHGVGAMSTSAKHAKNVTFRIRGVGEGKSYDIRAYTVNNLNLPILKSLPREYVIGRKYIQNIARDFTEVQPKLLIGANCWQLIISRELSPISQGLAASKTNLGWVAVGSIGNQDIGVGHSFCLSAEGDAHDEHLQDLLTESLERQEQWPEKPRISPEILRAEQLLQATTVAGDKQWTTGLLWRHDATIMPANRNMAMTRLRSVERQMDRNKDFADAYCRQIERYVAEGYAHEVTPTMLNSMENTWYLPHFAVVNPAKPEKLRVVFDGAAACQGTSLNSCLVAGPDLYNSIVGILFRFRERPVAFAADIKDFFLRIKIQENDSCKQLFLWRGKDRQSEPLTMRMGVLLFGSKSSPCSAQYVRNANAERFVARYPEAVRATQHSFYVDDLLHGAETIEDAQRLIREISWIQNQGGFQLNNWASNDARVLADIPLERQATPNVALERGDLEAQRLLGLQWIPETDELTFNLRMFKVDRELLAGSRTPTKREILRVVMSLYDPKGYLGMVAVRAKLIMQHVWQSGIHWDQAVDSTIEKEWHSWLALLKETADVKIPRYYQTSQIAGERREVHVFCDASSEAMCAIAYLRVIKPYTAPVVTMIGSKTRVAPLKSLSIPRLELLAGLLGARLCQKIKTEHSIMIHEQFFWTDSRNVLWWVRSKASDHQQFVSNRLGVIDDLSQVNEWRWLSGKINPADDATRLHAPVCMKPSGRWFKGPEFLQKDRHEWPDEIPEAPAEADRAVLEYRPTLTLHIHEADKGLIAPERFSKYQRIVRTIAYVQKFVNLCRKTCQHRDISSDDIAAAEVLLIKDSQRRTFGRDMDCLKRKKDLLPGSRLKGLNAFLDGAGLVRLGGRIAAAFGVPYDTKYPLIIDGKDRVTQLLIKKVHEESLHSGVESVLTSLRQRYWLINPRRSVKKEIFRCLPCHMRKAKTITTIMGDLPAERLEAYTRPFSCAGVDTFGPMVVSVGRRREQRYGLLITCLSVRAIHVEMLDHLSTDSMMLALRRFFARRGRPRVIFSDNATNMRGSSVELREAMAGVDHERIKGELANKNITWRFIPPASPNFGGSWEIMVKAVKRALKAILKEQAPRVESLLTLFAEIESVINNRPLVHLSLDSRDAEPLTPQNFLLGYPYDDQPAGQFSDVDLCGKKQWRYVQCLADGFWKRWLNQVMPTMVARPKWHEATKPLKEGDLVLVVDPSLSRGSWPRGIVEKVFPDRHGIVRVIDVRANNRVYRRSISKIARLFVDQDDK